MLERERRIAVEKEAEWRAQVNEQKERADAKQLEKEQERATAAAMAANTRLQTRVSMDSVDGEVLGAIKKKSSVAAILSALPDEADEGDEGKGTEETGEERRARRKERRRERRRRRRAEESAAGNDEEEEKRRKRRARKRRASSTALSNEEVKTLKVFFAMIDQAGDDWITEKDIKAFAEMSGDYAMDEVRRKELGYEGMGE